MRDSRGAEHGSARRGHFSAGFISTVSLLRGLPRLFAARPKTPLRVMCIVAFDTLHGLRCGQRLPTSQVNVLATLLDFGACANASFDNKGFCRQEYQTTRRLLEQAGMGPLVDDYLQRLKELEKQRPSAGGDPRKYTQARLYRESVVRLSLGMLATLTFHLSSVEDGIRATHGDRDLAMLFRIVMQCQVIDDVLDYRQDASAGLPGFLTVPSSLPHAFELARQSANDYADTSDSSRSGELFPLWVALQMTSVCAKMSIAVGRWWRTRSLIGL